MDPSTLRKRTKGSEFLVDIDIDDPATAAARRSLSRGDFAPAEQLLKQATEPNQRAYVAEALGDWRGEPAFLEQWSASNPSPDVALVTAIQKMKWAWEARGGGYAPSVSDSAAMTFSQRLPIAKHRLLEAAKRNPSDATAMSWLMWCARGLGEAELSAKAFAESLKRSPGLRCAYSSALLTSSEKWFGSTEECLQFARTHAAGAPVAACAGVLLIEAHEYSFEQLDPMTSERKNYWLHSDVISDVAAANDACKRSGLPGMNGIRVRHWLAYGLWRCGQTKAAAEHFQHIGKVWNERPWGGIRKGFNWLLNPFGKARRQCKP